MRRVRWDLILLVILLLALFWFRMGFSMSTESLSYDSYLTVRSVEHILETGYPLREDSLSAVVPARLGSPVYDYILAGLVALAPIMYKILPNLFSVLLLVPVFFLARRITGSPPAALIATVLAGTGPFVLSSYLNTPAPMPVAISLFLLVIAMLHDPDKYLYWIIGATVLLTFLHPIIFLLSLSLLFMIVLLRLEGFGLDKRVNELFIFVTFLSVWYYVLVFKKALFLDGSQILWRNLPTQYAQLAFVTPTPLNILYGLGVVTFLFGVLGIYHALFEARTKQAFPIIAAVLAVMLVLLLRQIELRTGLILLILLLAIMAAHGLLMSKRYLEKTKAPWAVYPLGILVVLLFLFTAVIPGISEARSEMRGAPGIDDIAAYGAMRAQLPSNAIILTTFREAAAVQYYSGHTTLADTDFLLVRNAAELAGDVDAMYGAPFLTTVINLAEKWGITHILVSGDATEQYGKFKIRDERCLPTRILSATAAIHPVRCRGVRE